MSQQEILIFDSELRALAAEANRNPTSETGGDLYGLWSYAGRPVIFLATGPGPRARGTAGDFQQDTQFMMEAAQFLLGDFGLQYLGDWHSHHWLRLEAPSEGDRRRIFNFAAKRGWKQMAEIIVTHDGSDSPDRQPDSRSQHSRDYRHQGTAPYRPERLRSEFECVHPYLYLKPLERRPPVPAALRVLPGESPIRSTLALRQLPWLIGPRDLWASFPTDRIRVAGERATAPQERQGWLSGLFSKDQRRNALPDFTHTLMGDVDVRYEWRKEDKRGGWLTVPVENLGTITFYVYLTDGSRPQIHRVLLHADGELRDFSAAISLDSLNQHPDSAQRAIWELAELLSQTPQEGQP